MKTPSFTALAAAAIFSFALSARAQDLNPPVVVNPIADFTVTDGTPQTIIKLKNVVGLQGVTGTVVRFSTVLGDMDVELYDSAAPLNVANFLAYVNAGDYTEAIFQRLVPGFIVQGGGYTVAGGQITPVTPRADVQGEHTISNTTGTLALALSSGPNSGANEWFFNLANNGSGSTTDLDDTSDGGPFTVFGHVIEDGMTVLSAIGALHDYDFSSSLGRDFTNLPLLDSYDPSTGAKLSDVVLIKTIAPVPLLTKTPGDPTLLTVKVKSNSNPTLVTAAIVGKRLKLTYARGVTGTALITLRIKNAAKTKILTAFKVTVTEPQ